MRAYPCCQLCAGSAPHKFCKRSRECKCHYEQERRDRSKNGRPLYRDRTADEAIGRLPKGLRG